MDFQFTLPTRIRVQRGISNEIGTFAQEYHMSRILILTDPGVKNAGIVQGIEQSLTKSGINFVIYDDVKPNPRDIDCDAAAKFASQQQVDGIIAVGGGSVMDTAKGIGILLTHGGSINDYEGDSTLSREITPLICIPTTAGTGSEVTFFSVITDTRRKYKMSILDTRLAAKLALLDAELTKSLPASVTASTGMDALTHAIEAYTCRLASPITDGLALYAIEMIVNNLERAVFDGEKDMEARENMLVASLIAGMAFGNSDIASVHCMSEAIGGLYDTPHGVANSIFLPFVFEHNLSADVKKHAEVAYALGVNRQLSYEEAAQKGIEILFSLSKRVNIPKFSELPNVNPEDFQALAEASKKNISDPSNAREMSVKDYAQLFQKAYNY